VVAAGQPVATIAEDGEREVATSIPESRVDEIRHAATLDITLWAAPGKHYQGKLRDLAVDTDPATRTYAARVTIVAPDDAVRLGMTANVYLPGGADHQGLTLPLTAIYDTSGQPKVWVVDTKANRVHAVPVTLGGAQGESVLIASGLRGGETIVTAGAHVLHENQLVRLAESQLARP
jgi:RND family efflux transporter MFP subunit